MPMRVRDYEPGDLEFVKLWFQQQGFEYDLPDMDNENFIAKQTVLDDDDHPVMIVAARRTVELYLFGDKDFGTPGMRLEALKMMHGAIQKRLKALNVQDVHLWMPPQIVRSFGRRLMKMFGWKRPLWTDFSREV